MKKKAHPDAMLDAGRGRVHMVGACGVGMAGLAVLLKARGFRVSGCDLHAGDMARWLGRRGVRVGVGHDPAHVGRGVDWCVATSAVAAGNREVAAARKAGIPVLRRGEVLAAIVNRTRSVAIAGTHGKTTTSSIIAQVLQALGLKPAFCIGGEIAPLGGVAGPGNGEVLVVEADESDGTLALYRPGIAVVTNIEPDHLENFGGMAALRQCFRTFSAGARERVVYCADDPGARAVCAKFHNSFSYGFSAGAMLRAVSVRLGRESSSFGVALRGKRLGTVRLPLPGRHNIANSLAAVAVLTGMGLPFGDIARALAAVVLPARRFEKVVDGKDLVVISDYGHHPTEIKALMDAAAGLGRKRIVAVFQPHRYTRTLAMGAEFPAAFAGADKVVLLPVYEASEEVIEGGTTTDLYAHWRKQAAGRGRGRAKPPADVSLCSSLETAWAGLRRELRKGDLLLVVGAGSVETIAAWAKTEYESGSLPAFGGRSAVEQASRLAGTLRNSIVRANEPLGRKTTFGVGGKAEIWMEAGSEADLRKALKYCAKEGIPSRLLGAGSNTLVGDLGVSGLTIRLKGGVFGGIREMKDGLVAVGAGTSLARLLAWARVNGYSGLEFLEGIPGAFGGAIRMNAGAWGHSTGERVEWVRCLDHRGKETIVRHPEFGYRSGVEAAAILEAGIRLEHGDPAGIARRQRELAKKRAWMKGQRSAGSVFRNPPGGFAGKLIEKAGLKGATVGGASISRRHANVIVAGPDARASDILALVGMAKVAVKTRYGVDLREEVRVLE